MFDHRFGWYAFTRHGFVGAGFHEAVS